MKNLRIYKPGSNGAAVQFEMKLIGDKYKEWVVFADFAAQTGKDDNGNARFDWRSKENTDSKAICAKLSETDAAKLLCFMEDASLLGKDKGGKWNMSLFHDPSKSQAENDGVKKSTVVDITLGDRGYLLSASNKVGEDLKRVAVAISWDEAVLLKAFLGVFLQKVYS